MTHQVEKLDLRNTTNKADLMIFGWASVCYKGKQISSF